LNESVRTQDRDRPRRQPDADVVADLWRWNTRMPQDLDRVCDRLRLPQTLTVRMFKNRGEIRPPNLPRDALESPAN
jgi:hypothetical protein